MAPTKVFLTGATGYIGGDVLFRIAQAHPEWEITALVRSQEKGALVTKSYPNVRVVHGDLDSVDLIEEEASKANIVYHCADCDHVASATAISKGLATHKPENPGYWIHTSGTGILTFEDFRNSTVGVLRTKEYNDWDGIEEVTSLPPDALHRNVDVVVLDTPKNAGGVKTAIVCPPTIYGPGRGPVNTRSVQIYELAKTALKRKKAFQVGEGANIWHQVHVQDLSNLYLTLGEAAVAGGGQATWNHEGYYFAENGSFVWGDIQREIAKIGAEKGLLPSADMDVLTREQTEAEWAFGPYAWGSNSRGHAIRARKLFGWHPHRPLAMELLPDIVDREAKLLGLK